MFRQSLSIFNLFSSSNNHIWGWPWLLVCLFVCGFVFYSMLPTTLHHERMLKSKSWTKWPPKLGSQGVPKYNQRIVATLCWQAFLFFLQYLWFLDSITMLLKYLNKSFTKDKLLTENKEEISYWQGTREQLRNQFFICSLLFIYIN